MKSVYFVEDTVWTDAKGIQRSAHRYSTHTLSEVIAERALSLGLALDPTSEMAMKLMAGFGNSCATPAVDRDRWLDMDQITEPVAILRARNDPRVSFPPRGPLAAFVPPRAN